MCEAEVGDEQKGEDPTVNLLQEMVADLLGKEAAVFLPSGTMCNEIALRVHCRPGDEMLAHRTAHPIHFETGRPGRAGRRQRRARSTAPRGQFDAAALEAGDPAATAATRRAAGWSGSSRPATSAAARSGRWRPLRAVTEVARAPRPRHPPGRRAADERGGRQRRVGAGLRGAVRLGLDRLHQGAGRAGRRGAGRLARVHRRGVAAASSRWAAPCGRPASSPPAACTRSATTSSAWPRTTPTRGGWPRASPSSPACARSRRASRRTSSSSTLTGRARRAHAGRAAAGARRPHGRHGAAHRPRGHAPRRQRRADRAHARRRARGARGLSARNARARCYDRAATAPDETRMSTTNDEQTAPQPMASAPFLWQEDGRPDWGNMWTSFCELALLRRASAARPRERARARPPATPPTPTTRCWRRCAGASGRRRALRRVGCTGLARRHLRLAVDGRVDGRGDRARERRRPRGPRIGCCCRRAQDMLQDEVKSIVTVVAKTHHYWQGTSRGGDPAISACAIPSADHVRHGVRRRARPE